MGCQREAKDLGAFLRVLKRGSPSADGRVPPYLYRIVVRLCLDHLRKRRPLATDGLRPLTANCRLNSGRRERTGSAVRAAIGSLPANQRTAIVLRYYEGSAAAKRPRRWTAASRRSNGCWPGRGKRSKCGWGIFFQISRLFAGDFLSLPVCS